MDNQELHNRFRHHPPKDNDTVRKHEQMRAVMLYAADAVNDECPEGREKSLAITKLEEAMYWANAAIARNQERL